MHHFLLIVIVFLSIGCTKEVSENEIIGILKSSNHFPYTGAFIIPRASGYHLYQDSKELGYIHFVDKTYFEIGGIQDSSTTEKIQDIASVFKEAKLAALYGHDSFTMFGLGNRKALRSTPHFSDHRLLFLSLFSLFFKNLGTKGARRATEALRFATRPVFLQTCAY
jgi:hypothetical protein